MNFESSRICPCMLWLTHSSMLRVCVCLTPAVFGVHGISIITRLADLTVSPSCVAEATQTLPSDCVTVSRLTDVHIAVTLTANTRPTDNLGVTKVTTATPKYTHIHRCYNKSTCPLRASSILSVLTSHSWSLCILPDTGHMTHDQMPLVNRWDWNWNTHTVFIWFHFI